MSTAFLRSLVLPERLARYDELTPVLSCSPHSDPKSFIEMGVMIENVVTSAFNGILPFVTNKVGICGLPLLHHFSYDGF